MRCVCSGGWRAAGESADAARRAAMWVPEVFFSDPGTLTGPTGIEFVDADRWRLRFDVM